MAGMDGEMRQRIERALAGIDATGWIRGADLPRASRE